MDWLSAEAAGELRTKGHISTLHIWRTRRPFVACRAAVYSALAGAPGYLAAAGSRPVCVGFSGHGRQGRLAAERNYRSSPWISGGNGMPNEPRVIAIDDDRIHLTGLANGLSRHGIHCRSIHFTGDAEVVPPCPQARIIFADLRLGAGVSSPDQATEFSTLGHLIEERIKPSGPYCILLWTMHADQAQALQSFLERLRDAPSPVMVRALDKAVHFAVDGNLRDDGALMQAINATAGVWLRPGGALALAGAWSEIDDRDVDAMIEEIYASRLLHAGRGLGH